MRCENCKTKISASPGGTYCRFHKQELCRTIKPHCYSCGKQLKKEHIKQG